MTKGPSQATLLVEHALQSEGLELFHTPAGDGYVMLPAEMHRECWPIRSTALRRWLSRLYFLEAKVAPGGQALTDALSVLEGKALFEGYEHEVHLRVAAGDDGSVWLDLADEHWQAVHVTADGWKIVHDPPVRFRRARGMLPLPYPVRGGKLKELLPFVNVEKADVPLLFAELVGALRPKGPYIVLLVHGEQGSAKSTLVRVVRQLIDPNEAPVRREPKTGQDLIVAARNALLVCFDNVSSLTAELSDDLARIATGSGFGTRMLYTDLDEVIVQVSRPIVLNGIEEVATRGDLLDRGLILNLPPISTFSDEDQFWAAFEKKHPRILGALLDAVSTAIANYPSTRAPNVRMADFARWVIAAEPALGIEKGAFLQAYLANRSGAVQLTLEASPLSGPIEKIAWTGFDGTATELLERLNQMVGEATKKQRSWPKRPHLLSGKLKRLAPALRRTGIEIAFSRDKTARTITIRREDPISTDPENSVISVTERHQEAQPQAQSGIAVTHPSGNGASSTVTQRHPKRLDQAEMTLGDADDALLPLSTNGNERVETVRVLEDGERIETSYLSKDGENLITVTRWLDRQSDRNGEWRSKNRKRKLRPGEAEYYRGPTGP